MVGPPPTLSYFLLSDRSTEKKERGKRKQKMHSTSDVEEVSRIYRRTIQKGSHDPDNHEGMITHLEPDILECEVK